MTTLKLAELPYAYDALDPYMSGETLEYHHDKHHKAYTDNGNKLIIEKGYENKSVEQIIKTSHGKDTGVFNNVAQFWNHDFFWKCMTGKNGGGDKLPGLLESYINDSFDGVDDFRNQFMEAGKTQFGSGWAWLSFDPASGRLEVSNTSNAETPHLKGKIPILTCDVWEHAYYIDYRNARPKFLEAFTDNLINWEFVEDQLSKATSAKAA